MNRPEITYEVDPALKPDERLLITIKFDQEVGRYVLEVEKGIFRAGDKMHWIDKDHELEAIISQTEKLRLPVFAQGLSGLDGTTYRLVFESSGFVSSSCTWWVELPVEWADLEPIIRRIDATVRRALFEAENKGDGLSDT